MAEHPAFTAEYILIMTGKIPVISATQVRSVWPKPCGGCSPGSPAGTGIEESKRYIVKNKRVGV